MPSVRLDHEVVDDSPFNRDGQERLTRIAATLFAAWAGGVYGVGLGAPALAHLAGADWSAFSRAWLRDGAIIAFLVVTVAFFIALARRARG